MSDDLLSQVRGVLFDLDDTLFDHTRASREALVEASREFAATAVLDIETLCASFKRHNDECWALAGRGEMAREELALARFRRTLEGFRLAEPAPELLARAYAARYRGRPAEVPGARAAVLRLREAVPVGVVTNGFAELVEQKLRAIGLDGIVHPVVVADRLETMKPRPQPFRAALELLGLEPRDVLFVGDSLAQDVAGATGAGLRTCWFNPAGVAAPPEGPFAELVVRRLEELVHAVLGGAPAA